MATTAQGLVDGGLEAVQALGEQFTHITGRVVPYGVETDVGWFLEEFERGAFTNSIVKTPKIPLLLWHDNRSFPIGSAVSWDDRQDGLHARFRLAMTAVAQQAGQYARDDFLTGMSVGFSPVRSSWSYAAEWDPERGPEYMDSVTRHEARLLEVSLVSTPAYADAFVYDVQAQAVDGSSRSAVRNARLWLRQAQQHRVA